MAPVQKFLSATDLVADQAWFQSNVPTGTFSVGDWLFGGAGIAEMLRFHWKQSISEDVDHSKRKSQLERSPDRAHLSDIDDRL